MYMRWTISSASHHQHSRRPRPLASMARLCFGEPGSGCCIYREDNREGSIRRCLVPSRAERLSLTFLTRLIQIIIAVSTERALESVSLKDTQFSWVRKLHSSWETAPEQEQAWQRGTLQPRTMPNYAPFYPSFDPRQSRLGQDSGALPLETVPLFGSCSPWLFRLITSPMPELSIMLRQH